MSKKLIAFYSRADENYVNGLIKTLEVGNTEIVAGMIKELTGADVFKTRADGALCKGLQRMYRTGAG